MPPLFVVQAAKESTLPLILIPNCWWRLLKNTFLLLPRCLYLWVGAELIFYMRYFILYDSSMLWHNSALFHQITGRCSHYRTHSTLVTRQFGSSLTRAVVLLHHLTVSGAVYSLLYFSCLSSRPAVHGFANHLVTPRLREIAPFSCATFAPQHVTTRDHLHVTSWNYIGLSRNSWHIPISVKFEEKNDGPTYISARFKSKFIKYLSHKNITGKNCTETRDAHVVCPTQLRSYFCDVRRN
jgi:hypothetical protein